MKHIVDNKDNILEGELLAEILHMFTLARQLWVLHA